VSQSTRAPASTCSMVPQPWSGPKDDGNFQNMRSRPFEDRNAHRFAPGPLAGFNSCGVVHNICSAALPSARPSLKGYTSLTPRAADLFPVFVQPTIWVRWRHGDSACAKAPVWQRRSNALRFMKIRRPRFLRQSALGAGGILCGTRFASANTKPRNFDPYETVPFGKTKLDSLRPGIGLRRRAQCRLRKPGGN